MTETAGPIVRNAEQDAYWTGLAQQYLSQDAHERQSLLERLSPLDRTTLLAILSGPSQPPDLPQH